LPSPIDPVLTPISAPPVLVPVQQIPSPVVVHHQPIIMPEKRKPLKSLKKKKNIKHGSMMKDLGRWKPTDDLALIIGIQQTNDMKTVNRGVKFSCKFTTQELTSRWYSLLYDESISRIAVAAMRNLHPEMISAIQSKALFSKAEEEILSGIKSSESPTEEFFQELLTKNATIFYHARTPKSLLIHWELMRQYSLLSDQTIPLSTTPEGIQTFSDFEDTLVDSELMGEHKDENLDIEVSLADRRNKREIRTIENELTRWSVLLDNVTGIGISPEFDNQTLAILRGRAVRYLMRSREITFGRNSNDFTVDVNLALEGAAYKVSRKQGTIKLKSNGDFFVVNEGKRPIFIDGAPVVTGAKTKLNNNNVIEVRNSLEFSVNSLS
jgi:microspherule protein 1